MISLRVSLAVTALIVALASLVWWRAQRRVRRAGPTDRPLLCPGPRLPWRRRLAPWRLVHRPLCGYDLAGLSPGPDGSVVCPECARRVRSTREVRSTRSAWRKGRVGLIATALVLLGWHSPLVRTGSWSRFVPTGVLLYAKAKLGVSNPPLLERELSTRIHLKSLDAEQAGWAASLLVNDLRNDEVKWNAERAESLLYDLGRAGLPALRASLDSKDHQQRHLSARIMRVVAAGQTCDRLLAVSVEGLREHSGYGTESFQWLLEGRAGLRPHLRAAMTGDDAQQRLLAACIAGVTRDDALLELAAPILIDALADNKVEEDAKVAFRGLAGFTPEAVIPYLEPLVDRPEFQQRTMARELLVTLGAPEPLCTVVDAEPALITNVRRNPGQITSDELLLPRPLNQSGRDR